MNSYISIKDLLAEFVRKAWLLLICMIICSISLTFVKYIKDVNYAKEQENISENITFLEELIDSLSVKEKDELDYYIAQTRIYNQQQEYMENSIYFNLDASQMSVASVQYYITTQNTDKIYDIITMYNNYLINGGLFADLCAENKNFTQQYLSEIIKFKLPDMGNYNVSSVLNILVYQQNTELCDELMLQVKEYIEKFQNILLGKDLSHNLVIIEDILFETNDSNIIRNQKDYINSHKSLGIELKDLEQTLTSEQLEIAKMEVELEETEQEEIENESIKVSVSKKFILLGAILGILLGMALVAANYILRDTVKSSEMLKHIYKVNKLGEITIKKENSFEKVASKLFYNKKAISKKEELQLFISKLQVTCERENIEELVLTGEISKESEIMINDIIEELKQNGIIVKRVMDVCNNSKDFVLVNQLKKVVMIQTLRKTTQYNIQQEIALYQENKIDILGYIVLNA